MPKEGGGAITALPIDKIRLALYNCVLLPYHLYIHRLHWPGVTGK